jgi:hypothetical protein
MKWRRKQESENYCQDEQEANGFGWIHFVICEASWFGNSVLHQTNETAVV